MFSAGAKANIRDRYEINSCQRIGNTPLLYKMAGVIINLYFRNERYYPDEEENDKGVSELIYALVLNGASLSTVNEYVRLNFLVMDGVHFVLLYMMIIASLLKRRKIKI